MDSCRTWILLWLCCESGNFHIENATTSAIVEEGFTTLNEENPYVKLLENIYNISRDAHHTLKAMDYSDLDITSAEEFDEYVDGSAKRAIQILKPNKKNS